MAEGTTLLTNVVVVSRRKRSLLLQKERKGSAAKRMAFARDWLHTKGLHLSTSYEHKILGWGWKTLAKEGA
jgi:hypothetical protein